MIKDINDKEEKFNAFNAAINILKEQGKDNFILGLCGLAECIPDLAPGHQGRAIYTIYNDIDWKHPFANYVCGYLSKSVNCLNDFSEANMIYDLAKKIDTPHSAGAEFAREELIRGLLFSDMNESKKYDICLNLINNMDPKKSGKTPFNRMKFSIAGAEINGHINREKSDTLVELIEQKEKREKIVYCSPSKA